VSPPVDGYGNIPVGAALGAEELGVLERGGGGDALKPQQLGMLRQTAKLAMSSNKYIAQSSKYSFFVPYLYLSI